MISPKIEIINHFDELINRLDIEFDESLQNYKNEDVLSDLRCIKIGNSDGVKCYLYNTNGINWIQMNNQQKEKLWPESPKIVDYLKQVRMRTIEELRKAQEERLEYYKNNSSLFKDITHENKIEELRSKLFDEKFYFQARFSRLPRLAWAFNLFTFVTDFYMSKSNIEILE